GLLFNGLLGRLLGLLGGLGFFGGLGFLGRLCLHGRLGPFTFGRVAAGGRFPRRRGWRCGGDRRLLRRRCARGRRGAASRCREPVTTVQLSLNGSTTTILL